MQALYEEVAAMRAACGEAKLKSILAIGELGSMDNVYRASLVCMMAGSDTIKVILRADLWMPWLCFECHILS